MLGAILGDIIGSRFEFDKEKRDLKSEDFELFTDECHFTDDTILTVATADAILYNRNFADTYHEWGNKYLSGGYGSSFLSWLGSDEKKPYDSYGNGSAMRVSPVSWAYDNMFEVFNESEESAMVTHDHNEGVRGASAVAICVYLARYKTPKKIIREFIETYFEYDLSPSIDEIRPTYLFDASCQGSVPQAIICFLEAVSFEDAVRKAVSLGGDTDTQASIAGAIAEAYYGIPDELIGQLERYLPEEMIDICAAFSNKFRGEKEC